MKGLRDAFYEAMEIMLAIVVCWAMTVAVIVALIKINQAGWI